MKPVINKLLRDLQRNLLAGIITICPLFITWLIFDFILRNLAQAGLPVIHLLATIFPHSWLHQQWLQPALAIVMTVAMIYLVGHITSMVIGQQALNIFESVLDRLPFVAKVYGSVRQLIDTMMVRKETSQRVVLIDFPIAGQKCIGFLTRTMTDETSGRILAAVLVPNAINPTSAFLQVLPMERVTETGLTMEQAMGMLLTGGAVCPETIRYSPAAEAPGTAGISATH